MNYSECNDNYRSPLVLLTGRSRIRAVERERGPGAVTPPWGCPSEAGVDRGHPAPLLRSHLWVLPGALSGSLAQIPTAGHLAEALLVKLGALGSQGGPAASPAHPVSSLGAPWQLSTPPFPAPQPTLQSPTAQISQHSTPVLPQHCTPRLPVSLPRLQLWGHPLSPTWAWRHVPASRGQAAEWAQR